MCSRRVIRCSSMGFTHDSRDRRHSKAATVAPAKSTAITPPRRYEILRTVFWIDRVITTHHGKLIYWPFFSFFPQVNWVFKGIFYFITILAMVTLVEMAWQGFGQSLWSRMKTAWQAQVFLLIISIDWLGKKVSPLIRTVTNFLLATLVALHFTPVSKSVSRSFELVWLQGLRACF